MEKKFLGPIFGRKDKNGEDRNLWWLQGLFIILFLVGGGIFAVKATYQAASKLTGEKGDADQSASGLYKGDPRAARSGFFEGEADSDNSNMPSRSSLAGLTDSTPASSSGDEAAASAAAKAGVTPLKASDVGSGARSSNVTGLRDSGSQSVRPALAARQTAFSQMARSGSKAGGGVSSAMGAGRGGMQVQVRDGDGSAKVAATTGRSPNRSVFSSLKQGVQIALMGVQSGSMDTATQWNTAVFDGGQQTKRSIDYGGKGAALDKFDPKSVPGYLREDALKVSSADTLAIPKVGDLSDDATASAADPKNKKKNKQSSLSMNGSLYGGASSLLSPDDSEESESGNTTDDTQNKMSVLSDDMQMSIMGLGDEEADVTDDYIYSEPQMCTIPDTDVSGDGMYTVDDGTGCMHLCNETSCEMSCYA